MNDVELAKNFARVVGERNELALQLKLLEAQAEIMNTALNKASDLCEAAEKRNQRIRDAGRIACRRLRSRSEGSHSRTGRPVNREIQCDDASSHTSASLGRV